MKVLAFVFLAVLALSEAKIGKATTIGDNTVDPAATTVAQASSAAGAASLTVIPVTVVTVPSPVQTVQPVVTTVQNIPASSAQPTVAASTAKPVTVAASSSKPITVAASTPAPPTQGPTGPPTTPAPAGLDFGCTCNTSTVWNDVMFLFDNSASTGQRDLTDLLFTFRAFADNYNIDTVASTNKQVMRAGIITYASQPKLEYALGTVTTAQIVSGAFNPTTVVGDLETNLKDAIKMATQQLRGDNSRDSSKKVIVIFATTYNPRGDNAPQTVADEFREDGGIIVTYDYVPNGGGNSILKKVASPGYDIDSDQVDSFDKLLSSQCDANCYCPNNYEPYATTGDRKTPSGGCYWPVTAPSNEILANTRCQMFNNGIVVKIESSDKNAFVSNLFKPQRTFYIGATFDSFQSTWNWPDSKPLGYTNWCNNKVPTDPSLACAIASQTQNFCWQATSCRNAYGYVCEAAPCDSTHYCDTA